MPPYNVNYDNRNFILETALVIEKLTSVFLAELLDIKDYEKSLSLSGKYGALSLHQRVNLLIDIGALENQARSKIQSFMELRNKFMHDLDCRTFEECLNKISATQKFLIKTYSTKTEEHDEEKLGAICRSLTDDVLKITFGIVNKVFLKYGKDNVRALKILSNLVKDERA